MPDYICPHCGAEQEDTWESFRDLSCTEDTTVIWCGTCEKPARVTQIIDIRYEAEICQEEEGENDAG